MYRLDCRNFIIFLLQQYKSNIIKYMNTININNSNTINNNRNNITNTDLINSDTSIVDNLINNTLNLLLNHDYFIATSNLLVDIKSTCITTTAHLVVEQTGERQELAEIYLKSFLLK